jgi:hypothetical protein
LVQRSLDESAQPAGTHLRRALKPRARRGSIGESDGDVGTRVLADCGTGLRRACAGGVAHALATKRPHRENSRKPGDTLYLPVMSFYRYEKLHSDWPFWTTGRASHRMAGFLTN